MGRRYKCIWCGSGETTGKGVRRTKTMGNRRICRCKACGRKFTPKHQPGAPDAAEADQLQQSVIESQPRSEPAQQDPEAVQHNVKSVPAGNESAQTGAEPGRSKDEPDA